MELRQKLSKLDSTKSTASMRKGMAFKKEMLDSKISIAGYTK
jgi:hypothetical protein